MKTATILLAVLAFALASCGDSTVNPPAKLTKAEIYFPLHTGDEWRYAESMGGAVTDTLIVTVDRIAEFGNKKYYTVWSNWAFKKMAIVSIPDYFRTEGGKVYRYIDEGEELYADFDRAAPDSVNKNCRHVTASNLIVPVPAGTFADCVATAAYSSMYDAVPFENYAPNVGLILRQGRGPQHQLTYAKVDGKINGKK